MIKYLYMTICYKKVLSNVKKSLQKIKLLYITTFSHISAHSSTG